LFLQGTTELRDKLPLSFLIGTTSGEIKTPHKPTSSISIFNLCEYFPHNQWKGGEDKDNNAQIRYWPSAIADICAFNQHYFPFFTFTAEARDGKNREIKVDMLLDESSVVHVI
jgi:hypothetical protein